MLAFIHGWLLSLGLIFPLGVQNVFIFNQGIIHKKWTRAVPAVLMAAICDTLLILLAIFGVSLVVLQLAWFRYFLGVFGFFFILYMGWITWKSPSLSAANQPSKTWTLRRQLVFAASVSLLNPHAIMDTIGVIGTSSLSYPEWSSRALFALGCIVNSWIWFFSLMLLGYYFKSLKKADSLQPVVNRISAVIMWGCGILIVKNLLF